MIATYRAGSAARIGPRADNSVGCEWMDVVSLSKLCCLVSCLWFMIRILFVRLLPTLLLGYVVCDPAYDSSCVCCLCVGVTATHRAGSVRTADSGAARIGSHRPDKGGS